MQNAETAADTFKTAFTITDGDVEETSWTFIKGIIKEAIELGRATQAAEALPTVTAIQSALKALGRVAVIWDREDVANQLAEYFDGDYDPALAEEIIDTAWSEASDRLSDCTDADWEKINSALQDAIEHHKNQAAHRDPREAAQAALNAWEAARGGSDAEDAAIDVANALNNLLASTGGSVTERLNALGIDYKEALDDEEKPCLYLYPQNVEKEG